MNRSRAQTGFTIVELVVVLTLIGIISTVGVSRFLSQDSLAERGLFDDTRMALRYAQKLAVGTGCGVQVSFNASTGYKLRQRATSCSAGAYTRSVRNPGKGISQYASDSTSGMDYSITANSSGSGSVDVGAVQFNALGQAAILDSSGAEITDTLRATMTVGRWQLIIEAETGFVCGPVGDNGCI